MKSMLVACLIAIALLVSCSKDDNPVVPNLDPNTFTTVNVYFVKFNAATNDWDMSTKMLFFTTKIDHKGSFHKRMYNDNFTKDTKTFYSFLRNEPVGQFNILESIGCSVSDSMMGDTKYTYTYSSDAVGYLTQISHYDDNAKKQTFKNYIGNNGKIVSSNINNERHTYYEFGTNGLVSRTYTLDDKNEKVYEKHYFHDNNGFVTKVVDSSIAYANMMIIDEFKYDSQNRLSIYTYDIISEFSHTNYTTMFYYDNDGYLIKSTGTTTENGGLSNGHSLISYDNNHNPTEIIMTNMSGDKQGKIIFEYKTE